MENTKRKQPKSVGEIFKTYHPIEGFRKKHENQTDKQFKEWLNK